MILKGDVRSTLPFFFLFGLFAPAQSQAQSTTWTLSGRVFMDHNANAQKDQLDFGFPAAGVWAYEDINDNHTLDDRDKLILHTLSSAGGYFDFPDLPMKKYGMVVVLDRKDLSVDAIVTRQNVYVSPGDTTSILLSFQGRTNICYAVGDGSSPDSLMVMNTTSGRSVPFGGNLGTRYVEAMCLVPGGNTLFAVNKGRFGKINLNSGEFITYADSIGVGEGEEGPIRFSDTDGLTYDLSTRSLYGSLRRLFMPDILYKIDTLTGRYLPNAFGEGRDYVVLKGQEIMTEIDDIAAHPVSGKLYGVSNQSYEQGVNLLVEIDKNSGNTYVIDTLLYEGKLLSDVEGLGFDNYGRMFASTGGNAGGVANSLFEVNPILGTTQAIGEFTHSSDFESCDCLAARPNRITGRIFEDVNGNRKADTGEKGMAGITIYVSPDKRQHGSGENWEKPDSVVTDSDGQFIWHTFSNRDYVLRIKDELIPEGYTYTNGQMKSVSFKASKGGEVSESISFGLKHNSFLAEWIDFTNQATPGVGPVQASFIPTGHISLPLDMMKPRKTHLKLISMGKVVFYRMQILDYSADRKSRDLGFQSSYFQSIQEVGLGKGPLSHILMVLPDRFRIQIKDGTAEINGKVCNVQVCSGSSTVLLTLSGM